MHRTLRHSFVAALLTVGAARPAHAQNLGPFRQFLAIEPYYARTQLDVGSGVPRVSLNGYGGRLWVNLAPFAGPHRNLISHGALAFFATYSPDQANRNSTVLHYGAQHDAFFVNRPLGGFIDPFVSVGAGGFRIKTGTLASTNFSLSPGGGIRIPIPNRLQLRVDARDVMIFGSRTGTAGAKRTSQNLELLGALGITF